MHISKFLLTVGTVGVLVASFPAVAGPDNAAQAKMREALRQKMEEVNPPTAPTIAPAAVQPAPAASKSAPAAPAPQAAPPVARPPTEVVPVPVEPAVVVAPAAVAAAPKGQSSPIFSAVPVETEDAKIARMREAMRQQLAAEKAATTAVVAPVAVTAPVASAVKSPPVVAAPVAPVAASVETVPSPFSGSKQMRLEELLRRYKADEITPQEYHTKRAAIVAEP